MAARRKTVFIALLQYDEQSPIS